MRNLTESVIALVIQAGRDVILPRLPRVAAQEKSPGEWVTAADLTAEAFLTAALPGMLPGSIVVGEEAAHAHPDLLDQLSQPWVWLVDPLDGTANFAAGKGPFAVMVALLHHGETVASWMYDPLDEVIYCAELGAGATRNGIPVRCVGDSAIDTKTAADLRGAVLRRFLPEQFGRRVDAGGFANVTAGTMCAAAEYPAVASHEQDFVVFWRTLPWDHAPGVLFLEEAGGLARRFDGSRYRPADVAGTGLLAASSSGTWHLVRDVLAPVGD